uniref:Uncharacterized protein n=1 Tax=Odontella aurita TaxID=265563 RepID=A0A7S4JH34_9STRA|mmetsp:Transcript_46374/g.140461  ORF Transcript_46374/g.140461 Transcript_46374/m.140461 type:complete len:768 (+) Transcript_46374:332-2635(+)
MFADELGGSAARRRQEQAKARRRQIKQKKQERKTSSGVARTTFPTDVRNSSQSAALPATKPSLVPNEGAPSASQPSAVALALQERKKRNQQKLLIAAVVTIQSHYRAYRERDQIITSEGVLFDKRMSDLSTLRDIIHQAGKGEYVPPPATSSALAVQLLFLSHRTPHSRREGQVHSVRVTSIGSNAKETVLGINDMLVLSKENGHRISSLIRFVLLPGICSDDVNMDPFVPWIQTTGGRLRLERLLRLFLAYWTNPQATMCDETDSAIECFFRVILGLPNGTQEERKSTMKAREVVSHYCRKCLIKDTDGSSDTNGLDMIQMTRTLLLYGTGSPIPADAEKTREKCISSKDKTRGDKALALILDTVMRSNSEKLQSRFFSHFLTIPLLTWKISPSLLSGMAFGTSGCPPLILLLRNFVRLNGPSLSTGQLVALLPSKDVPLTTCPAPGVLCLLANLVQLGQLCPRLNGSDASKIDFNDASLYFDLLSVVIDLVPLGAFSSRQSAVEWLSLGGAHHTPIVLSSVVIDQCKTLVLDSYVRQLFKCAINDTAFNTDKILESKDEKDLKHEKDLIDVGTTSAANLAAKEAMIDRSKSFWQASKWAKKISQSMTSLLSGDSSRLSSQHATIRAKEGGKLLNTSSVARNLARGKEGKSAIVSMLGSQASARKDSTTDSVKGFSAVLLFSLCRTYGIILARWGGNGNGDIVQGAGKCDSEKSRGIATTQPDQHVLSLLNVLCFTTNIVPTTWAVIQSNKQVISEVSSCIDPEKR